MAVYKIENDGFRFQELDLEVFDFQRHFPDDISTLELFQFSENNLSLAKYWPEMSTGFSPIEGGENLLPDISCWIGATLLLAPKAFRLLGELFSQCGEFLPIFIEGEKYQIFNCLTVCEATNYSSGKLNFSSDCGNKYVAFKPQKEVDFHLYCTEMLKDAIDAFELKGISFERI